jgi:hypothetical protein
MTKKFIVSASEVIYFFEEIEAMSSDEAEEVFMNKWTNGDVMPNSSDGIEIDSIKQVHSK